MLDLRILHQAITLARFRNYARAAQALHMTQPALSRSIAGLEARLGEKLFDRTSRGVEPTAFGDLLLTRGRRLLDEATGLEREFKLMRRLDLGELRIGAGAFPAHLSVGKAVGRMLHRHPHLQIDVMADDLRAIVDAALHGRIEIAVIELSLVAGEPRLATEALPCHPGSFYCRAGHPLLAETAPTVARILDYPFAGTRMAPRVAKYFVELAKSGAIDRDTGDFMPPVKGDSIFMLKDIVLASDAVGAAPTALIAREIAAGTLAALSTRPSWLQTAYGFVFRRDAALSPAAEAFKDEVWKVEKALAAEEERANGVAPERGPPARRRARSSTPSSGPAP